MMVTNGQVAQAFADKADGLPSVEVADVTKVQADEATGPYFVVTTKEGQRFRVSVREG